MVCITAFGKPIGTVTRNEVVNYSICEMRVENEVEVVVNTESFFENTNRSPKFTDLEPQTQKIMKR